jgi:hypothetical protein
MKDPMEPSTPTDPPRKHVQRLAQPAYALVYAAIIPILQEIGRTHGYAIAVHGSMATDLDLLACPWTDGAQEAEVLVEAIRTHFSLMFQVTHQENPSIRSHGRRAWSMQFDQETGFAIGGPYLDVSVMPRILAAVSADETQYVPEPATTALETAIDEQETMPHGLIDVLRRVGRGVAPHADPDGLLSALVGLSTEEFERFRAHWSRWAESGAPCTRRP